jgi:hypothetical protein
MRFFSNLLEQKPACRRQGFEDSRVNQVLVILKHFYPPVLWRITGILDPSTP